MEADIKYMRLAIDEAKKGLGRTSPNPAVGAVIVKNDRVIGKGYHEKAGLPHAEINALGNAAEDVAGSTIYVTLEPCNHTGKTPPCTHAIVRAGIKRVVVGMVDPNPLVSGAGIRFLEGKGLDVSSGILADECEALNYPFVKFITTGLPWVVMKAGMSLDGRLNYAREERGWITGEKSLAYTHVLRNRFDAIMVGAETVRIDNPSLTTRLGDGTGRDPLRIVVNAQLSLSPELKIFSIKSSAPTWIFHADTVNERRVAEFSALANVRLMPVSSLPDGHLDLREVMQTLGRENICSVLVEGGAKLHGAMLSARLYDYAYLFQAPIFAGDDGVCLCSGLQVRDKSSAPGLACARYEQLGNDQLIQGRVRYAGH